MAETCEQRIASKLKSRIEDWSILSELGNCSDPDELSPAARDYAVDHIASDLSSYDGEDICEEARRMIYDMPLAVTRYTTFKVDISTGGPADWLEIACEDSEKDDGPYEIEHIVYHFSDWFDHAEEKLSGDDLAVAEDFVRALIPELQ